MKRVLSVILALSLVLSLCSVAFAATLSPDTNTKTVKAGEEVTVTLKLDEKIEKIVTIAYKLYFNPDLFELESSTGWTVSDAAKADKTGSYYMISTMDPTSQGLTYNAGVVCTLVFKAKADVTGTQNGSFSVAFMNGMDSSLAAIKHDAGAPISVTVEGAHVHSWTKAKDAKVATCKEAGNIEYYTCSCGKYAKLENGKYVEIALADTVIPKTNKHTLKPVDAVVSTTCGSDDVAAHYECTVCGKLFTDKDGKNETTLDKLTTKKAHTLVKVDAVAATCTTDGTKEHYKCTVCNRLFTDKNGNNETTADKLVIPAAHKLVKTGAIAATCTTTGNKEYWTCDVCKKHFADDKAKTEIKDLKEVTIAALGHELTKTEKVDSTCTATGHEAYWTCSRCKGIFADEQGTTATTLDKLTIAKKAHTPGDYVTNATEHFKTCSVCGIEIKDSRAKHTFVKDEATGVETCSVCGYAIGGKVDENHQHAAGNDWFRDENNHWHKCTDRKCTAHVDEAKHDFETVSTTKDGNKTTTVEKCKTCGYVKTTTVDNTPVTPTTPSKPGRPSGTKTVQSGKTFDAGVGVYVGLSILSLTGSAVVIGKKRKTR